MYNCNQIEESSFLIKKEKIQLGIQLMPGLPGFSEKSLEHSIRKIIEIDPDFVRIYPTIIIRGTQLEQLFLNKKFIPLELEEAVEICAKIKKNLDNSSIKIIKIGLHSDLNKGDIVGEKNAYHPAFAEFVNAQFILNLIEEKLKSEKILTIKIPHKYISNFYGHQKKYWHKIQKIIKTTDIKLMFDTGINKIEFIKL